MFSIDTWRPPGGCCCCHSKTVFGRTRRCIRNCITFTARACYFLLLWRAVSLLFSIFSTTHYCFGALATQSIFSDKDHRLRQPPSRVRCVSFRLKPPPTKVWVHLALLCVSLHLHVLYSFIHVMILLRCRLRPLVVVGCLHRGLHCTV